MDKDEELKPERVFTIVADPVTPAEKARRDKIDRSWRSSQKKRLETERANAAGRPIVRDSNRCGPCIRIGVVVRETAKFYVVAEDAHLRGGKPESYPQRRVLKASVHTEPCKCCEDHPETNYPMGFTG